MRMLTGWCQEHANNRIIPYPRGRVLGGSSAINVQMLSHPSKRDLDNWRDLGNENWSWDDLAPYFRKFETYNAPPDKVADTLGTQYIDPLLRGTDGPIQTAFPETDSSFVQEVWAETSDNLRLHKPTDPRSGSSLGAFNQLLSIDPKTMTRSYSASGYYAPNAGRPNLSLLTDAMVAKINFSGDNGEDHLRATGVDVIVGGKTFTVNAGKEVLLCAGVIQSPQLLEVSGIGSQSRLEQYGIKTLIDNPNVGENLQDHVMVPMAWEVVDGEKTLEAVRDPGVLNFVMQAYQTACAGPLANSATSVAFLPYATITGNDEVSTEKEVAEIFSAALPAQSTVTSKQNDLLRSQLLDPSNASTQFIVVPTGSDPSSTGVSAMFHHSIPGAYSTNLICLTRPFSRGSIHIQSADARVHPTIDPEYLSHPMDLDILAQSLIFAQKIAETEPLASKLKNRGKVAMPGMEIPSTLEKAKEHVRRNMVSEWHPMGTCAMLPREKGGVVSSELKVYGTANLRVVDASIFPLQVQGNIQSSVYAAAEKAADIIKASNKV
jgi:choline dehydrogenase